MGKVFFCYDASSMGYFFLTLPIPAIDFWRLGGCSGRQRRGAVSWYLSGGLKYKRRMGDPLRTELAVQDTSWQTFSSSQQLWPQLPLPPFRQPTKAKSDHVSQLPNRLVNPLRNSKNGDQSHGWSDLLRLAPCGWFWRCRQCENHPLPKDQLFLVWKLTQDPC